jgi:amidophosphoribosyltransferase
MFSDYKLKEACGICGVFNHKEAANFAYLILYALQHRGQESAGIVSTDKKNFYEYKSTGLVAEVFDKETIKKLKGNVAIGHNRYSTTGDDSFINIQPFTATLSSGNIAIAHNGNLTNTYKLRKSLTTKGAIFNSQSDTEIILHLIAHSKGNIITRLINSLKQIKGAYSLVILTKHSIIGVRDPYGFRPLTIGKMKDTIILSSETCSFELIGAKLLRDVKPGEVVIINDKGITSLQPFKKVEPKQCIFEYVYFARPDSILWEKDVYIVRKRLGELLFQESPVEADVVVPVPDSSVASAIGFAQASGIPFEFGLIRNHYIGRTFIEPKQSIRHFGVKLKFNAVRKFLKGKRVVVVDDSIVRGTTSRKIVKMIKAAGAKEVHLRIASPPIISPCFYGIDTPTRKELIAFSHSVEEIKKYSTADSLSYLSLDGLKKAAEKKENFCYACFTGKYLTEFE